MRWLFCALALAWCAAAPALAQGAASLLAPPAASKPAPALSPAETRQVLDLLNDPQKRAAFTATLETLSKAANAASPAKSAEPVKLAPNSVGAQLVRESSVWVSGLSGQLASFRRVLGDLPSVWLFTERTLENPAERARALDAAWRLATVLGLAGLAEWCGWRLLRRPVRTVAERAPEAAPPPALVAPEPVSAQVQAEILAREAAAGTADADQGPPGAPATALDPSSQEEKEVQHALRHRRFARTVRTLARLPYVLVCLALDLIPLGLFLGVGYAGTLFVDPRVQALLQVAMLAYAIFRLAVSVARMVFAPDLPTLRLIHVDDAGAAHAVRWVRRIFAIATLGYAAGQIGLLFGMPEQADDAFLKAAFLLVHVLLVIVVLQSRQWVAARIRSHNPAPRLGGRARNRLASVWHLVAIFYIVGLWLVWAAEVRNGYLRIWHLFLVTAGVITAARLVSIVLLGILDRALRPTADTGAASPGTRRRARYLPLLRGMVTSAVVLATTLALLQAYGVNTLVWFRSNALGGRLVSAMLTILLAAGLALVVWESVNASMDRRVERMTGQLQFARAARLRTLLPILRTMLLVALATVFGLTALSEVGVNIAPLLAGAGILGVAIGFGSQKLVQDFITGIFLLVENAMQVGDWVTVAGLSGSVENLSIRTMRLRAGDGSVHIVPFSSVSTVTNVNRGIGNAAVSVNVPIDEDADRVSEVLTSIAAEMRAEDRFAEMMRSDFQLWGVDKVDAGIVTIVGQIVCTDSGRWAVQREFNRRMTIRFKEQGLRIATPVQTVYNHIAHETPAAAPADTRARPPGQLERSPPPAALGNTS